MDPLQIEGSAILILLILLAMILVSGLRANEKEMKKRQMEIRSDLGSSIADIERVIDRVKNDLTSAGEEVREKLNAKMDRLEETRKDLRDKLDEVGDTAADQWDEFQRSARRALDNTKQTLREV